MTRQWEEQRKAAGDAALRDVRFVDGPQGAVVIVEIDGPVVYDASSLTPNMNMLELRDTQIPVNLERSLDTTSFGGPVDRITSFREGSDVKIIVASQTSSPAEIELDSKGNRLIWRFPGKKSPAAREAVIASREQNPRAVAAAPAPDQAAADIDDIDEIERSEVVSLGGTKVSGFSTPPVLAARPGTKVNGRSRWRGERIDIELQDAPIKDVLLLFSDIGRVNIIAGPEVQGSVTMKLSAVPWDQALDIILRSLNLGMVQEGNVIRVATLTALEEERRKAIEEANAQVQLKPLETRLIPLSYADVGDMLPKVQSVLSSRGSVTPDTRTNTLIVMDVAENIALAESLVRQLDSQTPQVLIEARIVEARTNWLRQLGIQWGFDFTASPGTGNPTGLLFPNSIGVGGGSGSNQSPTNGLILPGSAANPNYAVDLRLGLDRHRWRDRLQLRQPLGQPQHQLAPERRRGRGRGPDHLRAEDRHPRQHRGRHPAGRADPDLPGLCPGCQHALRQRDPRPAGHAPGHQRGRRAPRRTGPEERGRLRQHRRPG
ncbi:secretin and TonB N-terminal domain-containing protein [Pseudenhygromyxa sp. WMMC2535]|nr:secretin and TonB N-terminal domain-containing protein [Pseudenhygromyxa sp. WMMC2535]